LKTAAGKIIYLDPYFSDACNRLFGFKRIFPSLIDADRVRADLVLTTHDHGDHLDTDSIPAVAKNNPKCLFAGPVECQAAFRKLNVPEKNILLLEPHKPVTPLPGEKFTVIPVPADHGDLAPNALGLVLEIDGFRIYFPGDTAYREDLFRKAVGNKPLDILVPPINGKFGNLNAREAAQAVKFLNPKLAIPCHFWLFTQHNGDPGAFLDACKDLNVQSQTMVLAVGERICYP